MLRFTIPAIVIVGALAMVHPASAEPVAAPAPDHTQTSATAEQQPSLTAPVPAPSPQDAPAPATTGYLKNMIPVGFGWG